jgi:phytanoyl-CoA hydroxylase
MPTSIKNNNMTNENQFIQNRNITAENIRFYQDYGYLVARGLFSPAEVEELKNDTSKIFKGDYGRGRRDAAGRRT